jgi:hypothetical protein
MSRYAKQITEVINRNALVTLALARGYNAFLPVYDGGIDFILYNENTGDTKLIQLKGRWIIDKKYEGRNIWIAFHDRGHWYVAPHDEMVRHADAYGYTKTPSWTDDNAYSVKALTMRMLEDMRPYRFQTLEEVAEEAAEDQA